MWDLVQIASVSAMFAAFIVVTIMALRPRGVEDHQFQRFFTIAAAAFFIAVMSFLLEPVQF